MRKHIMEVKEQSVGLFSFDWVHETVNRTFPSSTYKNRIERLFDMARQKEISCIFLYGDREHFANLHYFTGFDPRFEEGLLVLPLEEEPVLLVGNEGFLYAEHLPDGIQKVLFQSLSLPGQPRSDGTREVLASVCSDAGLGPRDTVGIVGWKYFESADSADCRHTYDIPHYIIETIERFVPHDRILNCTDFMIHPGYGLRTRFDLDEMEVAELAGTKTSRSVYNVLKNLKPGMSEIEASSFFRIDGDPLVAHPNLNFTWKDTRRGLVSPGTSRLTYGSVCNIGFGYRSSMVARTALYARDRDDIPEPWEGITEKLFIPYFRVMTLWYESLRIGVSGRSIVKNLKLRVPEFSALGVGLNPGHLIHSDEWTSSIFTEVDDYPVRDGMGIQCDIIACPPHLPGVHVEDGLIIAGSELRAAFRERYPESWSRIERRRDFFQGVLHIRISDEVLPLSDIQGCLFPYMASLDRVLVNA
jgi:hypothetical protein